MNALFSIHDKSIKDFVIKIFLPAYVQFYLSNKFLVMVNITNSDCSVSQSECFIMNQFVNVVIHNSIYIDTCVILSLSFLSH